MSRLLMEKHFVKIVVCYNSDMKLEAKLENNNVERNTYSAL